MKSLGTILNLQNASPRIYGLEKNIVINWSMNQGEQWAVVGQNGAGKTLFADFLCGKYAIANGNIEYNFWNDDYKLKHLNKHYPTECIKKVSFESAYLLADYKKMYYQQRFHSLENEQSPLVRDLVENIDVDDIEKKEMCVRLNINSLFDKHIIMLSSGELRRLLIATILLQKPEIVIFDNPFIGLDKEMMKELNSFFSEISSFQKMIFIVPAFNEIPECVTHVLPVKDLEYQNPLTKDDFFTYNRDFFKNYNVSNVNLDLPQTVLENKNFEYVFRLKNINISYKDRTIFKDLSWDFKRGEKWALLGPNGAGKSTLLSLIVADNPKAYSQDVYIFDRKRGSGESIWDIKKPIGYISSEMHLYFNEDQPCKRIVSSGFFDTIGLFKKCSEEQEKLSLAWMNLVGIEYLADKSFLKISGGEQRLVLFARTMVKNPDVLILDEPLHGLDENYKYRLRIIIEKYCEQKGKSLIYVTHRREEIPSCVDKFFELKKL